MLDQPGLSHSVSKRKELKRKLTKKQMCTDGPLGHPWHQETVGSIYHKFSRGKLLSVWWLTPLISALGGQEQGAILTYTASSRTARSRKREPVSKQPNKQKSEAH